MAMKDHASSGSIYGLGFVGAVIYYLQHAATISMGIWGFIKAVFWPAVLVYKVLELLRM